MYSNANSYTYIYLQYNVFPPFASNVLCHSTCFRIHIYFINRKHYCDSNRLHLNAQGEPTESLMWWSTACASLDCICIFLCMLICLYVCCWVWVSSTVCTDLCMVCQIGTRRTSPVTCDWGNGEDTHPLDQQILQKIISCQILSDFRDCYLSVAKFHSVSFFINFFLRLPFVICKRSSCLHSNRLFVIAICHLQKTILCQIISDFFFKWLLLSFRVIFYPIFLITCCPLAKIRSDWHSNHQRRHCKILGGDISMMCYHHFDFWGSGHLSIMLKCRIENHSLVVSHLPSDN